MPVGRRDCAKSGVVSQMSFTEEVVGMRNNIQAGRGGREVGGLGEEGKSKGDVQVSMPARARHLPPRAPSGSTRRRSPIVCPCCSAPFPASRHLPPTLPHRHLVSNPV